MSSLIIKHFPDTAFPNTTFDDTKVVDGTIDEEEVFHYQMNMVAS